MTTTHIDAGKAVALAKFLIQALGEVKEIVSRPWNGVTIEQAHDPSAPPYGLSLVVDRLMIARDALAEVVTVPVRDASTGFSKEGTRILLDGDMGLLAAYVVQAGRAATEGVPMSIDARRMFGACAVTVSGLLAEAAMTHRTRGAEKEVDGDRESDPVATFRI